MNRQSGHPPRTARRQHRSGASLPHPLPYAQRNWQFFWIGLGGIGLGYILLNIPPANGFISMTLAPILLVAGYCVVIPVALLIGDKKENPPENG